MGEKFPKLRFALHYYEGGMCFQGSIVIEDGETVEETEGTYHGPRGG
jgi:hypothetical protein